MEGKTVYIKLKGNTETSKVPMQRNLFRRQEDDKMLCMLMERLLGVCG